MRNQESPYNIRICEACDQEISRRIVIGIEVNRFSRAPVILCKSCGPINLDLMQFCRELTVDCGKN